LAGAYDNAFASDPVSAFGGIIAVNRPFDLDIAHRMGDLSVEVVAAPAFTPEALALLRKKKNLRIVLVRGTEEANDGGRPPGMVAGGEWQVNQPPTANRHRPTAILSLRSIYGGVLVQELDRSQADMDPATWRIVSARQPAPEQLVDLAFAWRAARFVKSNAIVYVKDEAIVGVGAGQMSRVDSVMMAGHKAGARATGAVMASDAFFPFADGIEAAAKHGIVAVVQPGGSLRDDEVIEAGNRLGLVMAFTGARHFRH
jgi:phosphoribosylaminoimidazolecarboxamide formyltransferase/IMP cyclohydrolase